MIETSKKEKKGKKISKDILNIIRTTMRNNIELTHIADNKANVLLSLNALMITFLVPFIVPYRDVIQKYHLAIPIVILVLTAFIVIYVSAMVLKPSRFNQNRDLIKKGKYVSPFFFGNYYQMNKDEFAEYIQDALSNSEKVRDHLTEDLHYIGTRLGRKMSYVRLAFNIFTIGFFTSITLAILLVFIYGGNV